jgi:hypothetical protein
MDMLEARKYVSYAGFISVIAGLLLIPAQVYWHESFYGMELR